MISVYPANRSKTFLVDYDDDAKNIVTPTSASYAVYDEDDNEIVASTSLDLTGNPRGAQITLSVADNAVASNIGRAFRRLVLTYTVSNGNTFEREENFVLENSGLIQVGQNSFATYGSLILTSQDVSNIGAFHDATISDQRAALINAWYNIGDVPLKNLGLDQDYGSRQLTESLIGELSAPILTKLKRAQIIEADFILGGNPVEDRRRTGMISDSSGESTQFFRTSRPVELPICKAAANALRGLVKWGMKVSR